MDEEKHDKMWGKECVVEREQGSKKREGERERGARWGRGSECEQLLPNKAAV